MFRRRSLKYEVAAASLAVMATAPVLARDLGPFPNPGVMEREAGEGGVIEIPGIGPIPFPMPPGARVFGPRATPKEHSPQKPDEGRKEAGDEKNSGNSLDEWLTRLSKASDPDEAQALAILIRRSWARSGSDTADLLTSRAALAESLGQHDVAITLLDHVLALEPKWAEGFVQRAKAKASLGDVESALADLETAVRLEPRRFDAFAALGALEESKGDKKRALRAYRRSLDIDPRQDDLRKAEEKLRLDVEGRDI